MGALAEALENCTTNGRVFQIHLLKYLIDQCGLNPFAAQYVWATYMFAIHCMVQELELDNEEKLWELYPSQDSKGENAVKEMLQKDDDDDLWKHFPEADLLECKATVKVRLLQYPSYNPY